jgi:hypothetical protein
VAVASPGHGLGGAEQFGAYLKDVGDEEALKKLVDRNEFLRTMRGDVNDQVFTCKLVEEETQKRLQTLSDEELQESLQKISEYDPAEINADIKAISKILQEKK